MQTTSTSPEQKPSGLDWLKVGQSFVPAPLEPPKRKNVPNYLGEDLLEQSKRFFNVDKRKSAADYIDDEFSCEEDSKINDTGGQSKRTTLKPDQAKKKIKKKKKTNKKANKTQEKRLRKNSEEPPDLQKVDFLYKHKLKSHLFPITIMRFGVEDNLKYGLKIQEVPKFRRIKKNMILGLKSDASTQEILHELNAIQGVNNKSKPQSKNPRFFELPPEPFEPEDLPKSVPQTCLFTESFISLQNNQLSETKEENPLVFSLNRSQISAKEDEFLQETKRFNELLQKNPNDISIWLDFISFQRRMFYYLSNSNKCQQTILEKQLAIVEKALESEGLRNSSILILLRIKLLKDTNKGEDFFRICESAWMDYIEKNPKNPLFWNLFFNFRFTNFIKFSASVFRDESEHMIQRQVSGEILASLIRNICFIEKEMGYIERSIGIFQALIEFNLFAPQGLPFQEKLTHFQEYWEGKTCIKTGEIDNFNGWEDSIDSNKENLIKTEYQRSFLGKYEQIIRENRGILGEEHSDSEVASWAEEELKNSDEWRPKKAVNEHTNIESVILFEDIEPFLRMLEKNGDFSGEILNNFLDFLGFFMYFPNVYYFFKGFPQLSKDVFPKTEDNTISEFYYTQIQDKFKQMQNDEPFYEDSGFLSANNLDFFLRFWPLNEKKYLRKHFDELKVEYLRRIMHQIYRKWPVNEVMYYIFFLEGQFYLNPREDSMVFTSDKAKKARVNFKNILKNNEGNVGLWVIYGEIEFLKNKNITETKRVFDTILRVMEAKKRLLVYYFYCSFMVRMYNEHKVFQKEFSDCLILDNLRNLLLLLDAKQGNKESSNSNSGSYNYENKVFLLKFAAKRLENDFTLSLKKEKNNKKTRSKKAREILSKRGLTLYFLMLALSYSNFQEFCEILKKIELLRLFYQKNANYYPDLTANNNEIQLLFTNFCRLFKYQIRYYSHEDEQNYLRILSSVLHLYPNNAIFVNEILQKCDKNTLRINRLPKLKDLLGCKFLNLSVWILYLHKEIQRGKECEFALFQKRVASIFNEITKEEDCPLQRAISRLETLKTNDILPENLMSNMTKIFKLYQEFSEVLDFKENSKVNLYSLHRIPFCKDLYLRHLKNVTKNQESIKEVLMLILSKEFRFYKEPTFF